MELLDIVKGRMLRALLTGRPVIRRILDRH